MKDVIVVSYATHRAGLLDEYEQQLKDAQIDFHLESVELADGINSVTARWKFAFMLRMTKRFADYECIVFTDAWDVLFFGTRDDLMPKIPKVCAISAERDCWPEDDLAQQIAHHGPWRYCNAGMMGGSTQGIMAFVNGVSPFPELDLMEQQWLNRRLVEGRCPWMVDCATSLFYTVSQYHEDGSLQIKDGKLWNSHFNSFPQFLHFSGKCPTEPFQAMLRGEVDALRSEV